MLENETIIQVPTPIVEIFDELFAEKQVRVFVKLDYLTHPEVSGNKWRKLKYNLIEAKKLGTDTLVSFGGAYSNHIHALAAAAHYFGFQSVGIIRGDELNENSSKTLRFAHEKGMKLIFVDRATYREATQNPSPPRPQKGELPKTQPIDINNILSDVSCLISQKGELLKTPPLGVGGLGLIPEGGSNQLALVGVREMVEEIYGEISPQYICCAMGTGGTVAGILSSNMNKAQTIGFSVLKGGDFLREEVKKFLKVEPQNFALETKYHFGGYGKFDKILLDFIEDFEKKHQIPLDPIYTGKMFFGVLDKIKNDEFERGSNLVLVHTGGLQGKTA